MPSIQISPGHEMHYDVDDFTDPWGTPSTVLLLHGNAESGAAWYGWVPRLARQLRVVRPDMRGFGRSTPMPRDFAWSLDVVIGDYLRLMADSGSSGSTWSGRRSAERSPGPSPHAGRSVFSRSPWSARHRPFGRARRSGHPS